MMGGMDNVMARSGLILALVFVVLIAISRMIGNPLSEPEAPVVVYHTPSGSAPVNASAAPKAPTSFAGEVVRINRVVPGQEMEESVFFKDNQEIGKQKIVAGVVKDQSGTIPDGIVKVVDEYSHTTGTEEYYKGKKTGPSQIYYDNGVLKSESYYFGGKLLRYKEFFNDGTLRMEQDLSDARDYPNEREVGVGKIYYKEGALRYEWNLTNTLQQGYKKAYNQLGETTMVKLYDAAGNVIRGQ